MLTQPVSQLWHLTLGGIDFVSLQQEAAQMINMTSCLHICQYNYHSCTLECEARFGTRTLGHTSMSACALLHRTPMLT